MSGPRTSHWLPMVLSCVLASGCGGGGPDRIKVAFVSNNSEAFWKIAEAGTQKAAAEHDVEVLFRMPKSGDPALQKEIIDTLVNQNIKALAVSVIDPKSQRRYLDELAGKLPLLTQDNDAPDTRRRCYIGTNNYEAGKAVGRLVREAMPEGGALAIFVGQLTAINAQERRQGLLDELAGQKDAQGPMYGQYRLHNTYLDQPEGQQKCKENALIAINELQNEKNICFVGLWAYNPPMLYSAVKDKQKLGQIKIVGFDENFETLQGIEEGHIHGTVVQDPFRFGQEAVRIMAGLARDRQDVLPEDGILYIPHRVITREGGEGRVPVKEFRAELERLLGK